MDKVAIYARVSTVDNQEYGRQISDLTKVINKHGYKDNQIEIFAEKLSGYNKERPELNKLLSEAENFKCIYISEISRLGRDPLHTRKIIDNLSERNIPVYVDSIKQSTINDDGSRNSIMSIILQVLIEFAHSEAETMKQRMHSGKIQAIKKEGIISTSNVAYGYKNVDSKLVIDDEEAPIVKMIFKMVTEGIGTYLISQKLNQLKIPTRRTKTHSSEGFKLRNTEIKITNFEWNDVTIRQIVKNTIYYGKMKFKAEKEIKDKDGNIITPAVYEYVDKPEIAIISEELYNKCNNIITSRITKGDATFTYLLKNLIYCGKCGKKYIGKYQPTTKAQKAYICLSNKRVNVCDNSAPHLFMVESVFYDMFSKIDLKKYIENPNDLKKILESDLDKITSEITSIKSELADKKSEQKRLIQLYTSTPSFKLETFNEINDKVSKEIETLSDKLLIKRDKELEIKEALLNYSEEFNTIDLLFKAKDNRQELRNIFKQMISKVYVNKIDYNYTLLTYFIKVNGITLLQNLKLVIDTKSVRKNPHTGERTYRYIEIKSIENEPVFNSENKLMNEDDVIDELKNVIDKTNNNPMNLYTHNWIVIDKENYIFMNKKLDE
jgi:DNA invertase Pin-like site-specific DNA recombinase